MHAEMEHISSWLRIWHPGGEYGDPYEMFLGVRWISKTEIEIAGLKETPTRELWRAVKAECKRQNVERVLLVRIKGGKRIEKWHRVKRKTNGDIN